MPVSERPAYVGASTPTGPDPMSGCQDTERAGLATTEQGGVLFNAEPRIHYWQTPNNAQNALVRGAAEDQQAAVQTVPPGWFHPWVPVV